MGEKQPMAVYLLTAMASVGGFLFGYDTGVISGAMAVILDDPDGFLSSVEAGFWRDLWHTSIVASTIGAAAVFALLSSYPTERFGRKITIIMASVIFAVGSVVMGVAQSKEILLVGRVIVGAAIGIASTVVPVYISEAAPAELRGPLTVSYNTLVVAGQFVATLVCGAFSKVDSGWRWMLGLAGVPAMIQFIGFLFMPESPRWLLSRGREEEARKVLSRIRPDTVDTEQEIRDIQDSIQNDGQTDGYLKVGKRVLKNPPTRRALIIGCSLQMFQQISGINTIMYYSATVVQMAGVFSVERLGRRKLLLGSLAGVIISLLVIAVGFQVADVKSPSVIDPPPDTNWGSCSGIASCASCVQEDDCGFCQGPPGTPLAPGFCLSINSSHSTAGPCSNTPSHNSSYSWYPSYCPSPPATSWTIIVGLAAYLISFAAGIAPLPWTINSEIYPLWSRSFCTSVATSTNWSFNLVIALTFLFLTSWLTRYGAFYLYSVLAIVGWVLFLLVLPETKGINLEQMEQLFSGRVLVIKRNKLYEST